MMKTFTKNSAKTKFASLAFLLILSLQILQIAKVHAQVSGEQRIANTVKIINVEAINESRIGLIDGKIIVSIEDLNPQSSTYRLSYDLHSSGNNFISPILKSVNNKLTLSNARMGNYYNLKVIRNIDNEVSSTFGAFKVDNGSYIEGSISSNRTSTFCSNTMSYTDCAGTARTISNCNTGSAYNGLNNYRPCGVEIASQCSVFAISQWHCIDGNLSEPPSHNEFTPTNYIGAGLTALQASRINWIVCNYGCFDAGVDHAIWYIAGTGGTNNTIAQAAAAAVTVANGTELLMVFYKSLNGSYQDMVQWQCRTTSNCTCPNNLVTNPSFENGTNNWNWSGGNFNAGTGAVFCGNYSGDFEITNTSANWVSQTIGTDLPIGTVLSASVYAGTHDNSIAHSVQINFFDAAWNYVSAVVIPVNKVLSSAPAGPQLYTFTATVPANTKYTQAVFSGSGGWIKTDNWCVTSTPPAATGSIGDRVWGDANGNGIQDASETTPIVGVTVQLKNAAGTVIATTTTNATGNYLFSGLAAGNYKVVFPVSISGAVVTGANVGTDDNIDSDASQTTGETGTITLGSGQNITNVDAGYCPITLQLGNRVWNDVNNDGINNNGELGIATATVNLYIDNNNDNVADGAAIATTTTDANGFYNFANLGPGNYIVGVVTPAGFVSSSINGGDPDNDINLDDNGTLTVGNETRGSSITLVAGTEPDGTNTNTDNNITYDFGFYQTNIMNLGNVVWYDQNNNGTKDGIEPGLVGATVKLYADANNDNVADGAALATTTTIANGVYNFGGLTPGNYIVGVTIPAGYAVVTTNGGDPDNNTDNDNNGTNTSVAGEVRSSAITLALTTEPTTDGDGNNGNLTVDFGFTGTASIGDFVFFDTNANGVQDVTETAGVPNATVILTGPNGTTTTTTNASGIYNFPNLIPGTYTVTFTTPVGFNVSPSNVTIPGATDANDSDPVGGAVTGIVLTAGQINNTIDAGFYNCVPLNSGINGPTSICANEAAVFNATGAGSGSIYSWTFMSGTPATATGLNVSSTWTIPGEYDINLTVTKNGCTSNYLKSIAITQAVFANAGPDKDICSGSTATLGAGPSGPNGSGPANSSYNWTVIAGDPTSIINGANQSQALVAPTSTSTYQLTVTQGGCTRTDQITVVINVDKNPTANAGPNRTTLVGTPVVIGGSPTGIAPLATPGAALGYVWSAASGLNSTSIANPTATLTTAGTVNYRVIVFSVLTGCSDTSNMSITAIQPVNLGNNVWYDKNNNGIKDATEPAVVTTVNLYKDDNSDNVPDGAAIATTTSTGGVYNFANLYPGSYIVGAAIPNGYAPTATTANSANANSDIDNDNNAINIVGTEVRSNTVVLTAGGEPLTVIDADDNNGNLTVDFGFKGTASLGDFVWYDTDRDGIFDANEVGIANATVTLTYPDGSTLVTTTSATGSYNFANLISGSYNVLFSTPSGLKATLPNATGTGANDTNDSDPISGAVNGIVLSAGQVNNTIDAGFHNICSAVISGNVWHDIDEMTDNLVDSVGSSTALAIPNALNVSLVSNTTGLVVKTSLVSGNGRYAFLNVARGSYYIVLSTIPGAEGTTPPTAVLPTGWKNTGENLGTGPGRDLQINGLLNVAIGFECIANANFGIKFSNSGIGID